MNLDRRSFLRTATELSSVRELARTLEVLLKV